MPWNHGFSFALFIANLVFWKPLLFLAPASKEILNVGYLLLRVTCFPWKSRNSKKTNPLGKRWQWLLLSGPCLRAAGSCANIDDSGYSAFGIPSHSRLVGSEHRSWTVKRFVQRLPDLWPPCPALFHREMLETTALRAVGPFALRRHHFHCLEPWEQAFGPWTLRTLCEVTASKAFWMSVCVLLLRVLSIDWQGARNCMPVSPLVTRGSLDPHGDGVRWRGRWEGLGHKGGALMEPVSFINTGQRPSGQVSLEILSPPRRRQCSRMLCISNRHCVHR